jgi:alpha-tubulin suppressor-like RCC1 family protein
MRQYKKEFKMFTASNRILMISIILLNLCNISTAQMCWKLKAVSCGEVHSLAIADDNSLLSCGGSNGYYVLGQGQDISKSLTAQRVKVYVTEGMKIHLFVFDF